MNKKKKQYKMKRNKRKRDTCLGSMLDVGFTAELTIGQGIVYMLDLNFFNSKQMGSDRNPSRMDFYIVCFS